MVVVSWVSFGVSLLRFPNPLFQVSWVSFGVSQPVNTDPLQLFVSCPTVSPLLFSEGFGCLIIQVSVFRSSFLQFFEMNHAKVRADMVPGRLGLLVTLLLVLFNLSTEVSSTIPRSHSSSTFHRIVGTSSGFSSL